MRQFAKLFFAALVSVGLWAEAAQATIIDNFSEDQFQQAAGLDGSFSSGSVADVSILGGVRGIYVEKTSGSTKVSKSVKVDVDSSVPSLSLSRDASIGGRALVQWDGDGASLAPVIWDPRSNLSFNLGGIATPVDLTFGGESGILVRVLAADLAGQQLRFTLFGANATVASDALVSVPVIVGPPIDVLIPWAAFSKTLISNGAVFDAATAAVPTQVYAITLAITGPVDADVAFSLITTFAPEPTTATLLLLGLVPLWSQSRRWRQRQR